MATLEERLRQQQELAGISPEVAAALEVNDNLLIWNTLNSGQKRALGAAANSYEDFVAYGGVNLLLDSGIMNNKQVAKTIASQQSAEYRKIVSRYGTFNPLQASMNAQLYGRPNNLYDALTSSSGGGGGASPARPASSGSMALRARSSGYVYDPSGAGN